MMRSTVTSDTGKSGTKCLARSIAVAFAEEPALEAVTIDRIEQTVSLATIGRLPNDAVLSERISAGLREAQDVAQPEQCGLLSGEKDCQSCDTPLSPAEREKLRIEQRGHATTISRVTCPTARLFWRWRDIPWPRVVQKEIEFLDDPAHMDEWKPQLAAAVLCGLLGIAGYLLRETPLGLPGFALAYVAGAWYAAEEVWERLQKRVIDVHFLMLAVAAGSASIGAWGEGATLLFLFSFSGALEHYAMGRTQREIRSLFRDAPKMATVLDKEGGERELPVEQLRPGMRLLIKPGAQFPVDAELYSGQTASDESNLTGEATPVEKGIGDRVLAGTMNLWGAVEVTVLRSAQESALQKIVHLIKEAQRQKAPVQQFADKYGAYYTYLVLALSFVMFFVWWLAAGLPPFTAEGSTQSAFYRAMILLVVASPCALVLSIPSAVLAAIAFGARHGILFRGGAAVEKLAGITMVALDKTGTLSTGELRVESVESFPAGREREVALLAYSMERLSTHPLARAVTRHGKQQGLEAIKFDHFESVTGAGLRAQRDGKVCWLGKREWIESRTNAKTGAGGLDSEPGVSEIWLAEDDLLGRIVMRDDIRPQARSVIEELRRAGLRTIVLTGDRRAAAEHLKEQLRLDDVRSELKPDEKVSIVRSLTGQEQRVAMVGDGVNDAPSLAAAHIGVAMGARGSDAALEQADVVLMHDRLENVLAAYRLSQRARRIIRQNLVLSLGTVLVLVVFALAGSIPLTVGVIGHEGSTVVVVMNSLRLLFGKAQPN
jgi:Zn2+/Cd2+-exporting ATPase